MGRAAILGIEIGRCFDIQIGLGGGGLHREGLRRWRRGAAAADAGLYLAGAVEEARDGVLLGLKAVGDGLEAIFSADQRAVQLVIGNLQIGDAVFVSRLHLLVAVILGGDDAVLEDHIDGGEGHPAQEDQGQAGQRRLQRRAEGEELHPTVAADIDLPLRKRLMNPGPCALEQWRHRIGSLARSSVHTATRRHFTLLVLVGQPPVPEKRA